MDEKNSDVYFVYLLQTISRNGNKQYYTGHTKDLFKRIKKQHGKGHGAKFCRNKKKISLEYFESFLTKKEAMKRELEIKSYSKKKKEELIKNFNKS
ncbi:MAG: GIY-YIG nuclease family protein [Promethearchaeota archaeon]